MESESAGTFSMEPQPPQMLSRVLISKWKKTIAIGFYIDFDIGSWMVWLFGPVFNMAQVKAGSMDSEW